ncbi:MAG: MarR family transcriptional regulator [Deltaproteobacteria bacterium]|nr:MarR family transcriptional regulator [Deltaproteobacteria bacterium]
MPTKRVPAEDRTALSETEMNEVLFEALRAVYRFEREKVAEFGLDYGAIYLLQYLRRHPKAPISQVGEEMRLPISTISRMIDRLEDQGLVVRVQDSADGRRFLLSLKAKAKTLVASVERHSLEGLTGNLARLEPNDVAIVVSAARLLPAVLEVIDEEPAR